MAGEPLYQALSAPRTTVRYLRAKGRFRLVDFDDTAETFIPLQDATQGGATFREERVFNK